MRFLQLLFPTRVITNTTNLKPWKGVQLKEPAPTSPPPDVLELGNRLKLWMKHEFMSAADIVGSNFAMVATSFGMSNLLEMGQFHFTGILFYWVGIYFVYSMYRELTSELPIGATRSYLFLRKFANIKTPVSGPDAELIGLIDDVSRF